MDALIARRGMVFSDDIEDYPEGIIVPVDKPYRWTSADVIRKLKYASCKHFHKKNLKVGHAGTLDPLATGVLLVCIGKATKLAQELQSHDKQYLAGVSFGATTPSYDLEKEVDRMYPLEGVSEDALRAILPSFIGEQEQIAPLFSAKSVDGVRAYEMARKAYRAALRDGGEFDHSSTGLLSKQNIVISALQLVNYVPAPAGDIPPEIVSLRSTPPSKAGPLPLTLPKVARISGGISPAGASSRINVADVSGLELPRADILVDCSKGTYIRALARDLGEALGSGAFLNSLRRTRTGSFKVEDALGIEDAMALFS